MNETTICNLALRSIGANRIMSLDDTAGNAPICKDLFQPTLEALLVEHPWSCALHQAALALSSETPEFGFAYRYALPTSPRCLRVLRMDPEQDYRVVARWLETDAESVSIEYIRRMDDPNLLPPHLVVALAARLAAEITYPITKSQSLEEVRWKLYAAKLAEAKLRDAQEGRETVPYSDAAHNSSFLALRD